MMVVDPLMPPFTSRSTINSSCALLARMLNLRLDRVVGGDYLAGEGVVVREDEFLLVCIPPAAQTFARVLHGAVLLNGFQPTPVTTKVTNK